MTLWSLLFAQRAIASLPAVDKLRGVNIGGLFIVEAWMMVIIFYYLYLSGIWRLRLFDAYSGIQSRMSGRRWDAVLSLTNGAAYKVAFRIRIGSPTG
jgi:hypothetical protein